MCFLVADTENTCCHITFSERLSSINRSRDLGISFLKSYIEVSLCQKKSLFGSLILFCIAISLQSMHRFSNPEYLYSFEVPDKIYEDARFILFTGLHELRCS